MGIARYIVFRWSPAHSYQLTRGPMVYVICAVFAPPPAEASEIVHQDALAYSDFSQGVG